MANTKKTTELVVPFFTPPNSNKQPSIDDAVVELQSLYSGEWKKVVAQPFLGSMLTLEAFLGEEKFDELMQVR